MIHRPYEPADAEALAPLLDSIGRELEQRSTRLLEIEARQDQLRTSRAPRNGRRQAAELRQLEGEVSLHRRELRRCREELEGLGCSVVGTTPLTVRIPTSVGGAPRSQVWQQGQATED